MTSFKNKKIYIFCIFLILIFCVFWEIRLLRKKCYEYMYFEDIFYSNKHDELEKYMEESTINLNYAYKWYHYLPWYKLRNVSLENPWDKLIFTKNSQNDRRVKLLIKYGIVPDEVGLAAMLSFQRGWDFKMVKTLIDLGAPLNGYYEQEMHGDDIYMIRFYVLCHFFDSLPCISSDHDDQMLLEQLRYFYAKGNALNVSYTDDVEGSISPIMCVASSGYVESTKYLLALGVDLDLQYKQESVFDFVAKAVAAESGKSESVYKKKINEVNHLLQDYKLRNK